jgi:hypothetical protein
MTKLLFTEEYRPLEDFAPNFAAWLNSADRVNKSLPDYEAKRYYCQALTAGEAIFCNNYARHLIFGSPAPDLNEGSFDCSPMYRQALLEKIVRTVLERDDYVMPRAVKV